MSFACINTSAALRANTGHGARTLIGVGQSTAVQSGSLTGRCLLRWVQTRDCPGPWPVSAHPGNQAKGPHIPSTIAPADGAEAGTNTSKEPALIDIGLQPLTSGAMGLHYPWRLAGLEKRGPGIAETLRLQPGAA